MNAHPYADKFPMLSEPELAELAESIRANGLRNPIVVTPDGLILDGRNRAAACERIGIEPETVEYDGDDLAEYVIDCNVTRRNMTTGARAMATALVLAEDGRRDGGRWKRGSVVGNDESVSSDSGWAQRLKECGVVLDFRPDLAASVVDGTTSLNDAFTQADHARRSADADKLAEKARKRAAAEQARAEAERNEQIISALTGAQAVKYLGLIDAGQFTPAEAWAAYQEATRKDRERQAAIAHGWRSTNERIAECVRSLAIQAPGDSFVTEFYPHHAEFVVEGQRLTRERCEDAITFLQTVLKELVK
jgi:hypothetical protein